MIIEAPNKAARRSLLSAIKRLRNKVKASPFLTPTEKANKELMYKQIRGINVHVEDQGDRCIVREQ